MDEEASSVFEESPSLELLTPAACSCWNGHLPDPALFFIQIWESDYIFIQFEDSPNYKKNNSPVLWDTFKIEGIL